MAQYVAVYRCGHCRMVNIYGKSSERDRKLDYLKTIDCPVCMKKVELEKRENDTNRAVALSMKEGLPILEGSPRQVRWAILIRQNMIDRFTRLLQEGTEKEHFLKRTGLLKKEFERMTGKTMVIHSTKELQSIFTQVIENQLVLVKSETKAKYFIDHRDCDTGSFSRSSDNSLKPVIIHFLSLLFDTTKEEVQNALSNDGWI